MIIEGWLFLFIFYIISIISCSFAIKVENDCADRIDEDAANSAKGISAIGILFIIVHLIMTCVVIYKGNFYDGLYSCVEKSEKSIKGYYIILLLTSLLVLIASAIGSSVTTDCNRFEEDKKYVPAVNGAFTGISFFFALFIGYMYFNLKK